jgi:predicted HicB family RNase H-like nuclease
MSDLVVEVPDELYERLKRAAAESGMSVEDYASSLVNHYLEDNYGEV